jgi:hypothetical protein
MSTLDFVPLSPERRDEYPRFFEMRAFADSPLGRLLLLFPLHDPARTEWGRRSASEDRAAVTACIQTGSARGVLAYPGMVRS